MALNVDSLCEPYFHPPLTDVDYRTSSRGVSRKTSRRGSVSPMSSSPALPAGEDPGDKKDEISALDPRRFTPTLHANLVSEILSLRRELEGKNGLVLSLEENVASVKDENAKLQEDLAHHIKENKNVKRQMDTLEGGTLTAIEDLAKERDQMSASLADVKQRLEASQKKVRSQQEDADRAQAIYERDREKWEVERRILDRKVHVVEGRLRTVLSEVESVQAQGHQRKQSHGRSYSRERPPSRASGTRSAASRHRDSSATNDGELKNFRFSTGATATGSGSKTLADELQFDDDSDVGSDAGFPSPEALPEERPRPFSVQSHRQSVKARKLLGLAVDGEDDEERDCNNDVSQDSSAQAAETLAAKATPLPVYVDSSTQYELPLSFLEVDPQRLSTITEIENDSFLEEAASLPKTPQTAVPDTELGTLLRHTIPVVMVSSACQTIEPPLSPPETPTKDKKPALPDIKAEMVTASTQTVQTDANSESVASRDASSSVTQVPLIAIHPVASDSARSSIVLPPHTKNASCQASIPLSVQSASVQTEGIRIDERLERLPTHLHPAIIRPYSPSPSPSPDVQKNRNSQSSALRNSLHSSIHSRPSSLRRSFTEDQAPGRDTARNSNALTVDDDDHVSDDSFLRKEPLRKTLSKVHNAWQLVPQTDGEDAEDESDTEDRPPRLPSLEFDRPGKSAGKSSRAQKSPQKKFEERSGKVLKPIVTERPSDLKRAALISSGSAAHIQRARSPSEPAKSDRSSGQFPPFPVPDRSSSRKLPWSPSDGSGSPTSKGSQGKAPKQGRPPTKRPTMRKSRSAVDAGQHRHDRSRSHSPPPFESFAESLSSIPPPLPENEITSPYTPTFKHQQSGHQHKKSIASAAESAGSDQTTIVDAIAQTMIGEWMWKYVRRRKSFGLPETTGNDYDSAQGKDGMMTGGIRHQRWVWVAPYERAVMWSSKQPTSGSALLGKSGRKLTITSVLDVRDDTPMPKGAPSSSFFGRSILILTPQRALKFTASSLERHYVWLSALSFLAHTAADIKDLGSAPTAMPALPSYDAQPPSVTSYRQVSHPTVSTLRRHRIQDSIRVAKGKERPNPAKRAFTTPSHTTIPEQHDIPPEEAENHGAEAPYVPRRTTDTRKRSNTGPKSKPPNSLRSFSSSQKPSLPSIRSRRDSAGELPPPPKAQVRPSASFVNDGSKGQDRLGDGLYSIGKRDVNWNGSVASQKAESPNFFEAVDTVRMEAFIRGSGAYSNGKKEPPNSHPHSRKSSVANSAITTNSEPRGPGSVPAANGARNIAPQKSFTDPPSIRPEFNHVNTYSGVSSTIAPTSSVPLANTSAKREGRPSGFRKRSDNSPAANTGSYIGGIGRRPPFAPDPSSGINSPISPAFSTASGPIGFSSSARDPFEGFESGPLWRVGSNLSGAEGGGKG